jgi:hypothetical protein
VGTKSIRAYAVANAAAIDVNMSIATGVANGVAELHRRRGRAFVARMV